MQTTNANWSTARRSADGAAAGRPGGDDGAARGAVGFDIVLLGAFALLKLAIHLLVGTGYGYHRDELYYLACANHLDIGYVDHPALSVAILAVVRALAGDAVSTIRIVPAVAGAFTVVVIGLMVRRLGGGRFAMTLAMLAAVAAPFYLALDAYYSMNAFDVLAWAVGAWLLIGILQGTAPARSWIWLGVVTGLALENKISMLWFGGALFVALLLTPARNQLRARWPWIAAAIALVLVLPYAVWQLTHGLATLHFMKDAAEEKLAYKSVGAFFGEQVGGMLVTAAPVWMAGLVFYLVSPLGRSVRALGWMWIAIFVLLAASHTSRPSYLAPAYSWLLAGGGIAIERWTRSGPRGLRTGLCASIIAKGIFVAPLVLPVLPQPRLAAYAFESGAARVIDERRGTSPLPEFLAHMSGWSDIVRDVAGAYDTISPDERRDGVVILTPNYGEAAAVDLLGRPLGLPPASSGHNSYWLWGPPPTPRVAIVIGHRETELRGWFISVTPAGATHCQYCMSYENQPLWIVRGPRLPLAVVWRRLQVYE